MATNERVTNISADDGTLYCGRRSAEYFWAADWQWIFVLGSCFYLIYFSTCDSISTWYNINDTKVARKRDMILDRVTIKEGKTHCERGLITDPIAQNDGRKCRSLIKLAAWRGIHYFLVCIATWERNQIIIISYWVPKQRIVRAESTVMIKIEWHHKAVCWQNYISPISLLIDPEQVAIETFSTYKSDCTSKQHVKRLPNKLEDKADIRPVRALAQLAMFCCVADWADVILLYVYSGSRRLFVVAVAASTNLRIT